MMGFGLHGGYPSTGVRISPGLPSDLIEIMLGLMQLFPISNGYERGVCQEMRNLGDLLDDDRVIFVGLTASIAGLMWTLEPLVDMLFLLAMTPWVIPYFLLGLRPNSLHVRLTLRTVAITYALCGAPVLCGFLLLKSYHEYALFWSPLLGSFGGLDGGIGYQLVRRVLLL